MTDLTHSVHMMKTMQHDAMQRRAMAAMTAHARNPDEANPVASKLVARFDADESGDLSAEELDGTRLGEIVSGNTWDDVDSDGNGALSAEEIAGRHMDFLGWKAELHASRADARSMVMATVEDV